MILPCNSQKKGFVLYFICKLRLREYSNRKLIIGKNGEHKFQMSLESKGLRPQKANKQQQRKMNNICCHHLIYLCTLKIELISWYTKLNKEVRTVIDMRGVVPCLNAWLPHRVNQINDLILPGNTNKNRIYVLQRYRHWLYVIGRVTGIYIINWSRKYSGYMWKRLECRHDNCTKL